jgi:hypothetical protein
MIDIPKLKKTAIWFVPLLLFVAWLSAWSTIDGLVPMIHDLARQSASLRIGPLGFLQPVGTVLCLSLLALVLLRIWRFEKAAKKASR